jgi:uncharacterized BrkB/YihY/UPF0761 family membrane protein
MTAPHDIQPQQTQRSTTDIIATVAAWLLAVIAAGLSLAVSPLFTMAADPCGADNCNTHALDWAYVITWGGIALAAILGLGGTVFAAVRHRRMWVWPTAALALVIVAFVIGTALAGSVHPH